MTAPPDQPAPSDQPTQPTPLETRAISVSVDGGELLRSVSVDVRRGELLAIVGPNGAGKTTLLKALAGDLAPSAGEVLVDGRPIAELDARALARRRAVMPQSGYLPFLFTAREVVRMGRAPWSGERGEREHGARLADEAMGLTGTSRYAGRAYPTLSGGEQSRVTLARVLTQETPILLVDEPTAHLDPRHQHHVLELLRELAGEGAAIAAVMHDLNLAAGFADRVAVLSKGSLVSAAPPRESLAPDILRSVFGAEFIWLEHPDLDRPVLAQAGRAARPADG